MEATYKEMLAKYKKETDNALNIVKNNLIKEIGALEEATKQWKQEKTSMQKEIKELQEEVTCLKSHAHEEGEITEANKEVIKMEIVESVSKTIEGKMEATKDGWVQVVKKNLKQEVTKEVTEIAHKEVVASTLEEEKRRRARRLNIRVSGIKETIVTPEEDGKSLCLKLGLKEEEPTPFTKAWRGPQP